MLLGPNEILNDSLEATLLQWKRGKPGDCMGYAIGVCEQASDGSGGGKKEMRLVNRKKINWQGFAPTATADCAELPGGITHFLIDD